MGKEEFEVVATYSQDSKRFHRFTIDPGQPVLGTIYVSKGSKMPDCFTVKLKVKEAKTA